MRNLNQICNKNKSKNFFSIKAVIFILLILIIFIFQILPLFNLVYATLKSNKLFSFNMILSIYMKEQNLIALKNTLTTSLFTTIFCILFALPIAFIICRSDVRCGNFLRKIFYLSYMLPPFIGAMSWIMLLNPNEGLINNLLKNLFQLEKAPFNIYTMQGLIFAMTIFYFPYAFITLVNGFEKMDTSLEEASIIAGASQIKTIFKITLPIMFPTIISAAILVFVASMSSYGIVLLIGSNAKISTITTTIFELVSYSDIEALAKAGILAIMLMILVFVVLIIAYFVTKKSFNYTINEYKIKHKIRLGKYRATISVLIFIFAFIAVIIPFISIVVTGFIKDLSRPISISNLTFDYWIKILTHSSIVTSIKNSILTSMITATISVLIAIVISIYSNRIKIIGNKIPESMVMISSCVPNMVIAVALIMAFTGKYVLNLYNTIFILILAYISKYMFLAIKNISQAILNISKSIEEAARGYGASYYKIAKDIILPIIFPSIMAGWFLVFMPSFYELAMSILLYSPSTSTIGVELYHFQIFFSQQVASALATAIIIFVFFMNRLSVILRKRYNHETS